MLDLRRLQMLQQVAARGSIAAAAQALSVSPAAVSQQISALSRQLGVDLLRPHGRSVALTTAGQVMAQHADVVIGAVRQAESAVAAISATVGERASLAVLPSTIAGIVAPALSSLKHRHPQLTVTCTITDAAQLRELRLGSVDVVVGQRYALLPDQSANDVVVHHLLEDEVVVVGEREETGPVSLALLDGRRLALPPPSTECGRAIQQACTAVGLRPRSPYLTSDTSAALALARAGLALALVPRAALGPEGTDLPTAALVDRPIRREIFAATRAADDANPTMQALVVALLGAARGANDPAVARR